MPFPRLALMAATAVLSACAPTLDATPDALSPPAAVAEAPGSYLFSWAMYGDPVFDRDVLTFARAYAGAFGTPEATRQFGYTSNALEYPDAGRVEGALPELAAAAVDGQDIVVVMITTHGNEEMLALRPDPMGPLIPVSGDVLNGLLAPLSNDQQVIILQACYSGSLIDDIAAPNRIIMTAAAADRSSFGCNPDNDNTFFIRAMNQALGEGGSWEQIFARTQAIVTQMERDAGIPPSFASNPQSYVGSDMRAIWSAVPG